MADKVPVTPMLGAPPGRDTDSVADSISNLIRSLYGILSGISYRVNLALVADGTEAMTGPLVLESYVKTALPDATLYTAGLIYVTNEAGGAVPCFSDGTNWRRVTDRAIVS